MLWVKGQGQCLDPALPSFPTLAFPHKGFKLDSQLQGSWDEAWRDFDFSLRSLVMYFIQVFLSSE